MDFLALGPSAKCNFHFLFSHEETVLLKDFKGPLPSKLYYRFYDISLSDTSYGGAPVFAPVEAGELVEEINSCLKLINKENFFSNILFSTERSPTLVRTYGLFEFYDLLSQITNLSNSELSSIIKINKEKIMLASHVPLSNYPNSTPSIGSTPVPQSPLKV